MVSSRTVDILNLHFLSQYRTIDTTYLKPILLYILFFLSCTSTVAFAQENVPQPSGAIPSLFISKDSFESLIKKISDIEDSWKRDQLNNKKALASFLKSSEYQKEINSGNPHRKKKAEALLLAIKKELVKRLEEARKTRDERINNLNKEYSVGRRISFKATIIAITTKNVTSEPNDIEYTLLEVKSENQNIGLVDFKRKPFKYLVSQFSVDLLKCYEVSTNEEITLNGKIIEFSAIYNQDDDTTLLNIIVDDVCENEFYENRPYSFKSIELHCTQPSPKSVCVNIDKKSITNNSEKDSHPFLIHNKISDSNSSNLYYYPTAKQLILNNCFISSLKRNDDFTSVVQKILSFSSSNYHLKYNHTFNQYENSDNLSNVIFCTSTGQIGVITESSNSTPIISVLTTLNNQFKNTLLQIISKNIQENIIAANTRDSIQKYFIADFLISLGHADKDTKEWFESLTQSSTSQHLKEFEKAFKKREINRSLDELFLLSIYNKKKAAQKLTETRLLTSVANSLSMQLTPLSPHFRNWKLVKNTEFIIHNPYITLLDFILVTNGSIPNTLKRDPDFQLNSLNSKLIKKNIYKELKTNEKELFWDQLGYYEKCKYELQTNNSIIVKYCPSTFYNKHYIPSERKSCGRFSFLSHLFFKHPNLNGANLNNHKNAEFWITKDNRKFKTADPIFLSVRLSRNVWYDTNYINSKKEKQQCLDWRKKVAQIENIDNILKSFAPEKDWYKYTNSCPHCINNMFIGAFVERQRFYEEFSVINNIFSQYRASKRLDNKLGLHVYKRTHHSQFIDSLLYLDEYPEENTFKEIFQIILKLLNEDVINIGEESVANIFIKNLPQNKTSICPTHYSQMITLLKHQYPSIFLNIQKQLLELAVNEHSLQDYTKDQLELFATYTVPFFNKKESSHKATYNDYYILGRTLYYLSQNDWTHTQKWYNRYLESKNTNRNHQEVLIAPKVAFSLINNRINIKAILTCHNKQSISVGTLKLDTVSNSSLKGSIDWGKNKKNEVRLYYIPWHNGICLLANVPVTWPGSSEKKHKYRKFTETRELFIPFTNVVQANQNNTLDNLRSDSIEIVNINETSAFRSKPIAVSGNVFFEIEFQ